jgi:septation ring formation regulator EzrA
MRLAPDDTDYEINKIMAENERMTEDIAREAENKDIKEEISKLLKANLSNVEESSALEANISALKHRLISQDDEVDALEGGVNNLNSDLEKATQQANDIHISWQKQCEGISKQDLIIEGLRQQFNDLQQQSQHVTSLLLDEGRKRKSAEDSLRRVQEDLHNKARLI